MRRSDPRHGGIDFHAVLRDGQVRVWRAWFEQHGTFLTRESPETRPKFTATEEFVPASP